MKKLGTVLKWALLVWGAISLIAVIAIGFMLYFGSPRLGDLMPRERVDLASKSDVRFVLNWSELGDYRIERVIHSFESARSMTGDHLDAYAIKVTHIRTEELNTDNWKSATDLKEPILEALRMAADFAAQNRSWFPSSSEILTAKYYVRPWSVVLRGNYPTAAQLIIARPSDGMIFYVSVKT